MIGQFLLDEVKALFTTKDLAQRSRNRKEEWPQRTQKAQKISGVVGAGLKPALLASLGKRGSPVGEQPQPKLGISP
ncbi:MAG: hypothetical protein ACXWZE_15570, partial [Candidatus Binatia bacterium]